MQTQLLNKIVKRYNAKTSALTKADEGFTLIELMVVIVIVGILSAVGAPQLLNAQNAAKNSIAKTTVVNQAKECTAALMVGDGSDFTKVAKPSGLEDYTLTSASSGVDTCADDSVFAATGPDETWTVTLTDGFPSSPVEG